MRILQSAFKTLEFTFSQRSRPTNETMQVATGQAPGMERLMDNLLNIYTVPTQWQYLFDDTTERLKVVKELKTKINLQLQKEGITDRTLLNLYDEQENTLRRERAFLNSMRKRSTSSFTQEEKHSALGSFYADLHSLYSNTAMHREMVEYLSGRGERPNWVSASNPILRAMANEDANRRIEHKLAWDDAYISGHMQSEHGPDYFCCCRTVSKGGHDAKAHAATFW